MNRTGSHVFTLSVTHNSSCVILSPIYLFRTLHNVWTSYLLCDDWNIPTPIIWKPCVYSETSLKLCHNQVKLRMMSNSDIIWRDVALHFICITNWTTLENKLIETWILQQCSLPATFAASERYTLWIDFFFLFFFNWYFRIFVWKPNQYPNHEVMYWGQP